MDALTVCLVGSETLLGREMRDLLEDQPLPGKLQLLGAEEAAGILTEEGGELAFIASLDQERLAEARVVLLAGAIEGSRKAYELVKRESPRPVLVDLAGALEDQPQARLRAPVVEAKGTEFPADTIHVLAHPAAISLALLYTRLQPACPIARSVVQVFEPASERGQAGLTELQQQTVGLLSFKNLDKEIYDAQLAFNLLPRLGEEAKKPIEEIELRVDRHLASLVAGRAPHPSLRVVQAPVFHGYSFSVWVEFTDTQTIDDVSEAIASAYVEVRTGDEEHPSNVGVAGQSGITVGAIEKDRNNPRAFWLWIVADNFRVVAENARMVAEAYL